jgi:hypothetical protein
VDDDLVPPGTPDDVRARAALPVRAPSTDPTLGVDVDAGGRGEPPNRLVTIGDSLSQGMQSAAVFATDLSSSAIVAHELGWLDRFRFPRYPGRGGLPLNLELLARDLEERYGSELSLWEVPQALFRVRSLMDDIEDYWERGPGRVAPDVRTINHALAMYSWDLRDALSRTAASCAAAIEAPRDDLVGQVVRNHAERAALRVYPHFSPEASRRTLFDAARALGEEHDDTTECGIETLVVALGANNALKTITLLSVVWSDAGYRDVELKHAFTVWRPDHFAAELAEVAAAVRAVPARHVIWCTVPHVTIAPIARGVSAKVRPGSRYFPYYTRPWISDDRFEPDRDPHLTAADARAIDAAIDLYNEGLERVVEDARRGTDGRPRDWCLLDLAGLLDRLASRRYIEDVDARPPWWTPYELPPALQALDPPPDSHFLTGDGRGGRASGGLFSVDGVHPTTVGYGLLARELVFVMRRAGVQFRTPSGVPRPDPVDVDFDRLLRRDLLVRRPPQNLTSALDLLEWGDQALDLFTALLGRRSF